MKTVKKPDTVETSLKIIGQYKKYNLLILLKVSPIPTGHMPGHLSKAIRRRRGPPKKSISLLGPPLLHCRDLLSNYQKRSKDASRLKRPSLKDQQHHLISRLTLYI
jgi:hypothetical protein